MHTLILILHITVAICLIISILMQSSKGEGLAGAFGGGTFSSAVFGGRGSATFLARATAVLAVTFALTSIGLTMTSRSTKVQSAVQKAAGTIPNPQQQAPIGVGQGTNPAGQPAQPQTKTSKEPNIFDVNQPASQSQKSTDQKTPKSGPK